MDNSKILKLTTFDGSPTEFVALINEFGKVEPVFYDLSNPESLKALELDYDGYYDKEKYAERWAQLAKKAMECDYLSAMKINGSDYHDPIFHNGEFHQSAAHFAAECKLVGNPIPDYVNGSRRSEVYGQALLAETVIDDYLIDFGLEDALDKLDKESITLLQSALDNFGAKNKNRVVGYKPDSTKVVLLHEYQCSP